MNLNLDALLGKWDFSVTYAGRTAATKPIDLASLAALAALADTRGDDQMAAAAEAFAAVFEEPVVDWLKSFPPEAVGPTIKAFLEYMAAHMTKNSRAIAAAAKAAMAPPLTQPTFSDPSGPSTPQSS